MTKQLSFRHTIGLLWLCLVPILGTSQIFEFKQNQKWGLINEEGQVLLSARFDRIEASKDRTHFYLYKDGKTGVFHRAKGVLADPTFDHIFPLKHGYYVVAEKGKYGIMDTLGKVLSPTKYDRFRQDGMYFYTYSGKKMGLLQPRIGELLEAKYDTIFRFEKKYFCSINNRMAGLIDTVGKRIEPPNYHGIRHLYKEWYIVKYNDKWGMKKLGVPSMYYPMEYSYIGTFDRDEVRLQLTKNKYSRIEDFDKNLILDSIPGRLYDFFGDRYAYTRGKGIGLMSLDAKPLSAPVFSRIRDIHKDYFRVTYKGKLGAMTREGKVVVKPRFSGIFVDSTRHIWARSGEKWGVLSPEGEPLFRPTFDEYSSFQNHVARVEVVKWDTLQRQVYRRVGHSMQLITETYYVDSTKYGLINQHGEYLAPIEYDDIKVYLKAARLSKFWDDQTTQVAFDKEGRKSNRFQLMVDSNTGAYDMRKEEEREAADTTQVAALDTIPDTYTWVRINGRWGLKSAKDTINIWRISPRYHYMIPLDSMEIALVGRKGRRDAYMLYGFVDFVQGRQITPINYKKVYIEDFEEKEYARVIESNNLFNIIHKSGKSAITNRRNYFTFWKRYSRYGIDYPPTFIGKLQNGWARVRFGGAVIDNLELAEEEYEKNLREDGGRWGLMYFGGTFKLEPKYSYIGEALEGNFSFSVRNKWGIMDTSLQAVIPPTYDLLEDYTATSQLFIGAYNTRKLSVLDIHGKFENEIDLNNQTLIVDTKDIQDISILKEGMLAFKQGGRWGFLNSKGEIAIYPTFIDVGDFSNGLAKARTGRLWGYINKKGEFIIPERYRRADDFHGGIAATNSSKGWKFININGERAIRQSVKAMKPFHHGKSIVMSVKSNKWGIIDTAGTWALEPEYDKITLHEDYYLVKKERKYGYLDDQLNEVIPISYSYLGEKSEGKILFRDKGQYGFLDSKGNKIIEPKVGVVYPFSSGRAAIKNRTTWGFLDKKGDLVIDYQYLRIRPFSQGVAAVARKNNSPQGGVSWGFIDTTGRTIVPIRYRTVRQNKQGILSCLDANDEWKYFDRYGIPLSHNTYRKASEYKKDLSEVELNDFNYLMDLNTGLVTNPGYDDILSWEDTQILVLSQKRKGLIDRKGKEILNFEFEQIKYFDGLYQVIQNGKVGYLNGDGKWIWPMQE